MPINKEFSMFVANLVKPGDEIIGDMTPHKAHEMHMAMGIAGEAGELLDAIKKYVIYGKPLDRENVIEELGDLEFYITGLRDSLDIKRSDTIEYNMRKLSKRYHEGKFTNQAAQDRLDKK